MKKVLLSVQIFKLKSQNHYNKDIIKPQQRSINGIIDAF